MVINVDNKPNPHCFYGDGWYRGKNPWLPESFPEEFRGEINPNQSRGGWFLDDAWGNQIYFIPDGVNK